MTSDIILQKTVNDIANSIGIENLTSAVSTILSQNGEIYILEILEKANALSVAFKRSQLRRSDINDILVSLKQPPLLGYKQKIPVMSVIPFSREEVLVACQPRKLDLESIAISDLMQYELTPHFDISYLVHEEHDMRYFSPVHRGIDTEDSGTFTEDENDSGSNRKRKVVLSLTDQRDEAPEKKMSRLQNYFQKTIEYVTYENNRLDIILEHVQKDVGVGKLLHRYIDFFNEFLISEQNNFHKMIRVLKLLSAICVNKEYQIEEYIDQILSIAFTFLTTHYIDEQSTLLERVKFKGKVANLFSIICEHCATELPSLKSQVGDALKSIEENSISENDPETFYGCLKVYSELGVDIIRMYFINRVKEIHQHIQKLDPCNKDIQCILIDVFHMILYQLFIEERNNFKNQQKVFEQLFEDKKEKKDRKRIEDEDNTSQIEKEKLFMDLPLSFLSDKQREDAISCLPPEFYFFLSTIYNDHSSFQDDFII